MLNKLKWLGYLTLSLLGIAATVTVAALLSTLFAALGIISFGVAVVWFIAFCIKSYIEEDKPTNET